MLHEILTATLVVTGSAFMLLAGIGIIRMPDLFMRMGAATKGATLGAGCLLVSVAIHFQSLDVGSRAVLVIVFVFMTAPVAAHLIARAAYAAGVPLWEKTIHDDMKAATHEPDQLPQIPQAISKPHSATDASDSPARS